MARRRQSPQPVVPELPTELRRDAVTVELFAARSERPPSYWSDADGLEYRDWRWIRALRRWQSAVEMWVRGVVWTGEC